MRTGRIWLLRLLFPILALLLIVSPVAAQEWRFQVNERIVHVFVNEDGSVWIDYSITFTPDPGAHVLDIIDVGLPTSDYNLAEVSADVGGVAIKDIRHSEMVFPGVEIHMGKLAIQPGQTGTLHVLARVRNMVFQEPSDPEYASFRFSPHWYDSANAHGTMHLEVMIHFPEGVTSDEARYETKFTDAAIVDNRVTYAWINDSASPSRRYEFAVAFPKKYLKSGLPLVVTPEPTKAPVLGGRSLTDILCSGPVCVILGIAVFILFIVLGAKSSAARKLKYLPPVVGVEGAGIKRGLAAVEAALLLEAPLNKVLTMILFGLMKKETVRVLSQDPLRLQANAPLPEDLRDYEKDFVAAISDNQLNEKQLRQVMVGLIKSVNEKMKGFSRKDSIAYYKDLVSRAWQQVESADTPEVKSQRLDDGFEWTMLDEGWNKKVEQTFGDGPVILPRWWWSYPSPSTTVPSQGAQPVGAPKTAPSSSGGKPITMPTLPGAAFANTLVTGVEGFSNRMVSSVERFTGSISSITNPPPPAPKSSSTGRWRSGGGGGGGGCACACACAGCACACAGGGR